MTNGLFRYDGSHYHSPSVTFQVILMCKLLKQISNIAPKLQTAFSLTPNLHSSSSPFPIHTSHGPPPTPTSPFPTTTAPTSPTKSRRILSSVTSSGHQPDLVEAASVSSPDLTPRDGECHDDGMKPRLSLWLQWTLQKCGVKLYSKGRDEHGK